MSNKRRNKKYSGKDAKQTAPIIKKYSVNDTSAFQRWKQDHKPMIILRSVQAGALAIGGLLLWGIISLIF